MKDEPKKKLLRERHPKGAFKQNIMGFPKWKNNDINKMLGRAWWQVGSWIKPFCGIHGENVSGFHQQTSGYSPANMRGKHQVDNKTLWITEINREHQRTKIFAYGFLTLPWVNSKIVGKCWQMMVNYGKLW